MANPSPVLRSLARLYAASKAGRTGSAGRDFLVDLRKLLADANCLDGDDRDTALRQLREWHGSLLQLEGPRRDLDIIHRVRFAPANEARLFALLGDFSPRLQREAFSRQFIVAEQEQVPEAWRESWIRYCKTLATAALAGEPTYPFSRDDLEANAELLHLVPALLTWHAQGDESLLRFASCVLTGNSKRLGLLAPEGVDGSHGGRLGAALTAVTGGRLRCLEDVGILPAPRFVLLHGPIRLQLKEAWLDLGGLLGPVRLSETDVNGASAIETSACRCLTVENETTFHELAKLHSGVLLVCTSYPGSATLALLQKLPGALEFWHFGDTDPEGFDILRDLRERSGRPFRALHMNWRPSDSGKVINDSEGRLLDRLLASDAMREEHQVLAQILARGDKGSFEQESLGRPQMRDWPFYGRAA